MRICMFFAFLLTTSLALAQPPAETCGVGDSLSGAEMLPVNAALMASIDDFDMSATGCTEQGFDHVTCLTPTTSCTVQAECAAGTSFPQLAPPETSGLQVAVNVFSGGCTTTPASCIDSDIGTASGLITGLALSAGTTYCFVCEVGFVESINLQILATSGDCGALPVDLQTFEIEGSE